MSKTASIHSKDLDCECEQCEDDIENRQIIRLDSPLIKPSSLIGHGLHQLLWLVKAVRVLDCLLKGS